MSPRTKLTLSMPPVERLASAILSVPWVMSSPTAFPRGRLLPRANVMSPVPQAMSSTCSSPRSASMRTSFIFQELSIPYERNLVMKSYLGAMIANIRLTYHCFFSVDEMCSFRFGLALIPISELKTRCELEKDRAACERIGLQDLRQGPRLGTGSEKRRRVAALQKATLKTRRRP